MCRVKLWPEPPRYRLETKEKIPERKKFRSGILLCQFFCIRKFLLRLLFGLCVHFLVCFLRGHGTAGFGAGRVHRRWLYSRLGRYNKMRAQMIHMIDGVLGTFFGADAAVDTYQRVNGRKVVLN